MLYGFDLIELNGIDLPRSWSARPPWLTCCLGTGNGRRRLMLQPEPVQADRVSLIMAAPSHAFTIAREFHAAKGAGYTSAQLLDEG